MDKKSMMVLLIVLVLAGVLAFVYLNKSKQTAPTKSAAASPTASNTGQPAPAPSKSTAVFPIGNNIITVQNFAFAPQVLEIKAGQKVTWRHNDAVTHTVVSSNNLFKSGALNRGDEFSFTFNGAGAYDYHCGIHPSMTGKIIVK